MPHEGRATPLLSRAETARKVARHQAWPDALARQGDNNSPAKRPGLVDRELSTARASRMARSYQSMRWRRSVTKNDKAALELAMKIAAKDPSRAAQLKDFLDGDEFNPP